MMRLTCQGPCCIVMETIERLPMSDTTTPLRKLRDARGFTQAEVCKAVGIDQSTLSKIEKGTYAPRKETAIALVKFFGPALNELHLFFPERFDDYEVGPR